MRKFGLYSAAALFAASVAHAGYLQPAAISFDDGPDSTWAYGDLLTVAYDADSDAFIGCGARSISGYSWGFCQAGSADHDVIVCNTDDPELLDVIKNISDSANLAFQMENATGQCTYIASSTQSFYQRNWKETGKRKKQGGATE